MDLTEALRNYVEDKISLLDRHFGSEPTNIDVELEHMTTHHSGPIFRCEINIKIPSEQFVLRADSTQEDMYAAIDTCLPKIKERLEKERHKNEALLKKGGRKFKEMMRSFWE